MKKVILTLITCFSVFQSIPAFALVPTNLDESLAEYDAIISSSLVSGGTVIPSTEFIVDIKRLTRSIDLVAGNVYYKIVTRLPELDFDYSADVEARRLGHCRRREDRNTNSYIATLTITLVDDVPTITVTSLVPASSNRTQFHLNEEVEAALSK